MYLNPSLYIGLFDGVVPALLGGIPAGATFFAAKDSVKQLLKDSGMNRELTTVLAVAAANIPYWVVRNPSEVLKTRAQVRSFSKKNHSEENRAKQGIAANVSAFFSADTLNKFYGSYASSLLYALPADILKFLACKIKAISVYLHQLYLFTIYCF